jgi:hypothetical protein
VTLPRHTLPVQGAARDRRFHAKRPPEMKKAAEVSLGGLAKNLVGVLA